MAEQNDNPNIPKLELEKFTFSPPGPMGWSFSEYEKILDNPSSINVNHPSGLEFSQQLSNRHIIEYPSNPQYALSYVVTERKSKSVQADGLATELASAVEPAELNEDKLITEEISEIPEIPEEKPFPRIKIIIDMGSKKTPWLSPALRRR